MTCQAHATAGRCMYAMWMLCQQHGQPKRGAKTADTTGKAHASFGSTAVTPRTTQVHNAQRIYGYVVDSMVGGGTALSSLARSEEWEGEERGLALAHESQREFYSRSICTKRASCALLFLRVPLEAIDHDSRVATKECCHRLCSAAAWRTREEPYGLLTAHREGKIGSTAQQWVFIGTTTTAFALSFFWRAIPESTNQNNPLRVSLALTVSSSRYLSMR